MDVAGCDWWSISETLRKEDFYSSIWDVTSGMSIRIQ